MNVVGTARPTSEAPRETPMPPAFEPGVVPREDTADAGLCAAAPGGTYDDAYNPDPWLGTVVVAGIVAGVLHSLRDASLRSPRVFSLVALGRECE